MGPLWILDWGPAGIQIVATLDLTLQPMDFNLVCVFFPLANSNLFQMGLDTWGIGMVPALLGLVLL